MKVPLKPGWKIKISAIKPRILFLENKTCQLVNMTFNKMHCLGRLKFIFEYILFSFLVFIVGKFDIKDKKKSRAVVDIQKVNKIVLPDSYPLSL